MTFNKTILAGAAALLAVAPAAFAQTGDTMSTTTTTTTTSAVPTIPMPEKIDYSVLNNPTFDYIDLAQAKARGFSDTQIATIAKLAEKTGERFGYINDAVLRGESFPMLATKYGLQLSDVYDVSDEKAKIEDYKKAYETTGTWALKALKDKETMAPMSGSMSGTGMNNTTTGTTGTTDTPK